MEMSRSFLVLSTKKRYSSFLKRVFAFQKIWFWVSRHSQTISEIENCNIKVNLMKLTSCMWGQRTPQITIVTGPGKVVYLHYATFPLTRILWTLCLSISFFSKVEVLKSLKIFSDCHINAGRSQRTIFKIHGTIF